jgi:glycosyltransferase involved in cell wall biosynthesis/peptidoglycan/xylan/chitin deacetylase (PgdA/CDA1 family)
MTGDCAPPQGLLLSVVVPTYQRRDLLARTLQTMFDQETTSAGFEVLVVVDGSTDGTLEMLSGRFSGNRLRVLSQDNAGPAAARNLGIQSARGSIILFLDDDILCPPGLFAAHLAGHAGSEDRIVFGPVLGLAGDSTSAELTRLALDGYYTRMREEWDPDTALTAYVAPNSSVRREALLKVGGFDTRFARAHEDADLGLRLRKEGLRFFYLPESPVRQVFTKKAQELAVDDAAIHGHGEVLLCRTHPSLRRPSFLSRIGDGGILARGIRAAATRSPLSPELLLRPAFELAERLPAAWLRRSRLWLLSQRSGLARFRAAAAAAGGWDALRQEFGRRCAVLFYHHVGPAQSGMPPTLSTDPASFERQMRHLHRRGYTAITAGRWLQWLAAGVALPERPFVLTFDDGYADLAEHAFPVLRDLGFGATVFVVSGRVDGVNDWDGELGMPAMPLLGAGQIRVWSREGIEFGSHTRTHVLLDAVDEGRIREELRASRCDLEAIVGEGVRTFCYPYGVITPTAAAVAAECYDLAFGCGEGLNALSTDPHRQHRTMVQPGDTLLDLELRTRLGWSPLAAARARLRLRSRVHRLLRRSTA